MTCKEFFEICKNNNIDIQSRASGFTMSQFDEIVKEECSFREMVDFVMEEHNVKKR